MNPLMSNITLFLFSFHKLQEIGKAVLPTLITKALPSPTTSESTVVPEAKAETVSEPKVEAINSVPSSEAEPKPRPSFSSPYPYVSFSFISKEIKTFRYLCFWNFTPMGYS